MCIRDRFWLRRNPIDLIILDVYMPQMSGTELLLQLRAEGVDADVIMVTSANDAKTVNDAVRLGAVDYLCLLYTSDHAVFVDRHQTLIQCIQNIHALQKQLTERVRLIAQQFPLDPLGKPHAEQTADAKRCLLYTSRCV